MGEQKRKRQAGHEQAPAERKSSGFRLTWRGVLLFMSAMVLLDVLFYVVFRFGFESCYAVLCLLD